MLWCFTGNSLVNGMFWQAQCHWGAFWGLLYAPWGGLWAPLGAPGGGRCAPRGSLRLHLAPWSGVMASFGGRLGSYGRLWGGCASQVGTSGRSVGYLGGPLGSLWVCLGVPVPRRGDHGAASGSHAGLGCGPSGGPRT